jgi:hypothetical protein
VLVPVGVPMAICSTSLNLCDNWISFLTEASFARLPTPCLRSAVSNQYASSDLITGEVCLTFEWVLPTVLRVIPHSANIYIKETQPPLPENTVTPTSQYSCMSDAAHGPFDFSKAASKSLAHLVHSGPGKC